jgi:RNA polymerase sigma-70 factor, ECF subfamily
MESPPRHAESAVSPDLFARITKGDRDAFGRLYDLSSPLLFTLALRILKDRDEAADLLQEVYLEVWKKSVRYDPRRGSPMSWLIVLTRSRAIDRLRARGARKTALTDSLEETGAAAVPDDAPSPLDRQAEAEHRTLVVKALGDLPDAQRQALALAYYEGLSHTEIAERLSQPVGTIKTRIKLGMTKLKTALKPCFE